MYGLPVKEVQRSDQVSDVSQQEADSDLLVNNLSYHQPEALSLAVARTYQRQFFQRDTYSAGQTAVIDFNSGSDFVDPGNSYITFTVQLTQSAGTAATAGWGQSSAMNVINQVTIKSRSGTELDRVERANLWSSYYTAYTNTSAYLTKQGQLEGWAKTPGTNEYELKSTAAVRYVIPLKRLAPFFNPIKRGQKIPPQLMSGLHMEIIFESAAVALMQNPADVGPGTTNTISGYTIGSLAIMTDSVCMTDDVQKTINDQSASSGLEYAYTRYFKDEVSTSSSSVNVQVRKAVSQANIAWSVPLLVADQVIANDSFRSEVWLATQFQYRLGALYFPQQAIQDSGSDGKEGYMQALEMWDKLKHPEVESSVALENFKGSADVGKLSRGIFAVSLEKDTALNLSGLPVNNSRVLELVNTSFSTGVARNIVTFLEYSAVARSYIDNAQVAI